MEIQIQTTTLCNATCVMCPYPEVSKEFPVGKMSDDLYQKILAECSTEKGLRRIEPFLMNEAFIDKRMPEMIAQAKQMVPHAAVTVTTNGTPLVPKVTDRLIDAGLDAIWFSFNGATPATYEKIMGIPYEKVKANIEYLLQTKPESLQVFINMIETIPMAGEIEENIAYWKSLGIQAGSSPLVNRGGNVKNFAELNYKAISEVPVRTCELVFYKMYILHNGDAILCCMDWRRNVVLGNVYEKSIREIWNGEVYQEIRRKHIEGRDGEIDLCANCSYTLN
ncbi:MAG: radical SAM/SPASM domain-containing protein [Bacteroidota bacterium]